MTTGTRVHFLTLAVGERFRFAPGGPVFVRVDGRDDPAWCREADDRGPRRPLSSVVGFEGCSVHFEVPGEEDEG